MYCGGKLLSYPAVKFLRELSKKFIINCLLYWAILYRKKIDLCSSLPRDFPFTAKKVEFSFSCSPRKKSREFGIFAPRDRLFLDFLPDFLREIFPLTFPLCSFEADFPTCRDYPCDGRDILFLPTLVLPSARGRRKRRDSLRKSLQGLRLRLFFSFSHNPKVMWFKSLLRNQESNPCMCP